MAKKKSSRKRPAKITNDLLEKLQEAMNDNIRPTPKAKPSKKGDKDGAKKEKG